MTPSLTPLAISANHRYLVDGTGTPFLIQGDAGWELIVSTTQSEADQYLTARASQGFNLIQVNLIDHLFGPNAPANMAGAYPFLNSSTGQHRAFIDAPNEAYFAYADWVINDAASKGMYVLLDPSYLGFGGGNEGFYQDMRTAGSTAMRQWGQYVGNRYKNFTNIIWQEGADYNPPADGVNFVNQVALGIKDAGANQIQTAHTVRESSAVDVWGSSSWLDFNSTYTSTLTYNRSLVDYNRTPVTPSFLIEDIYENEHGITQQQGRAEKYWNVLSGSTGALMGNNPIWGFDYFGSWQGSLSSQLATDMSRLGTVFESQPWYNLVPDQGHTVVTAGYGTFGQSNYVTAARTGDGSLVMAYVPSSRTLTVDMTKLSGSVTARWYDPTNGIYTTVNGSPFANTGSRSFTTPGNNSKGDSDWVLLLDAAAPTIPSAPMNLTATAGNSQVTLSWTASSGAASYNIYRSTTSGNETLLQSGVTTTSFINTGLTNGITYFYKVAAVNSAGASGLSNEAFATPQVGAPAAPTNLTATAGNSQVTLSWTASNGAASYNIYRSTTSGNETLLQSGVTTTSFTNTGLTNGTTYFYKVAAVNAGGTSALSNEASATPTAATFTGAHINFSTSTGEAVNGYRADTGFAFGDRGNGLTFGWNADNTAQARDRDLANSPDELHDSFNQLQRPNNPNASWEIAVPNGTYTVHLGAGDAGFFDSVYKINVEGVLAINGTPTSTQHWFENTVTVIVTDGRLTISNAVNAVNNKIDFIEVIAASVAPPASPTNLTATAGSTQISLSWTASSGAASYNIYRSTTSGNETLLQSGVTTTSFINTGLTNGITYFYKVAAVNSAGASGLSNEAFATPQVGAPAAPTNLTATAGNSQVTLSWTASNGAASYNIYRSTTSGNETLLQSGVTTTSFTNTGLTNGTTYFYKVAAVNAGGTSALSNEASATPTAATFTGAHINFSTSTGEAVNGYRADTGFAFGDRGNGLTFGWNADNTAQARDRDLANSPDELHDSFNQLQRPNNPNASWEIAVPNGTYTVHLGAGDAGFFDSVYKINVEGVLAINGTPTSTQHWFENTVTVIVTDGRLTISNAAGAVNNKINFIDITPLS